MAAQKLLGYKVIAATSYYFEGPPNADGTENVASMARPLTVPSHALAGFRSALRAAERNNPTFDLFGGTIKAAGVYYQVAK